MYLHVCVSQHVCGSYRMAVGNVCPSTWSELTALGLLARCLAHSLPSAHFQLRFQLRYLLLT